MRSRRSSWLALAPWLALAVLVGACAGRPIGSAPPVVTNGTGPGISMPPSATPSPSPTGPSAGASLDPSPVSKTVRTDPFEITVTVPHRHASTAVAIAPIVSFRYLGPDAAITIYHGSPLVVWRLRQVDGPRRMDGGVDDVCLQTTLARGTPVVQPFTKGGQVSDDPFVGFDIAFFRDPELHLPAGRWEVSASMEFALGGCGAAGQVVTASVEVDVAP